MIEYDLDYIIINDSSTDRTAKICKEKKFNVINLIQNLKIGGAVQTGYVYADFKGYDVPVQFDGDGQHDINSLSQLLTPVISGQNDFLL